MAVDSIRSAPDFAATCALLQDCGLPVADLREQDMQRFFYRADSDKLTAVVGYQEHAGDYLLRSLAVVPGHRGQGLARDLVTALESRLRAAGVHRVWLLTETAVEFFTALGYSARARESAPAGIRNCPEFAALCPASAILMGRTLGVAAANEGDSHEP